MDTLPLELIRLIASPASPALLLTCSRYLPLLTPCDRYDHLINIGYTIEVSSEVTEWMKHNRTHRNGGPALIYTDGNEEWYQHDKIHRDDEPAVLCGSSKLWFQDGELHRDDGPAAILYVDDWEAIRQYIPLDHLPEAGNDLMIWCHRGEYILVEKS